MAGMRGSLGLTSMNHISLLCRSIEKSREFYQDVLGFFPIKRPGSFDFNGAWLFGYGIGLHLLQSEDPENMVTRKRKINPKDNHISFLCESMVGVEQMLKEMKVEYVSNVVEEDGILVDQLFFHDPDGFMIEICNCDQLPIIPLTSDAHHHQTATINIVGANCSSSILNERQQQQQQQHQLSNGIQVASEDHHDQSYFPCA
ncbi:hypothetical protein Scep_008431 [Stephania cephalantha]|uniref:VOC domain-containing protein n=1 Tax=Stephania cephalantha TaxID=152367 RepID=A0AAP0KDN2_9MAGN